MTVIGEKDIFRGGTLNSWSSLSSYTHQIYPALVRTFLKYTLQSSKSSTYHDDDTLQSCMACMCDNEQYACQLECTQLNLPGHTRQWKNLITIIFMLNMFNLLVIYDIMKILRKKMTQLINE